MAFSSVFLTAPYLLVFLSPIHPLLVEAPLPSAKAAASTSTSNNDTKNPTAIVDMGGINRDKLFNAIAETMYDYATVTAKKQMSHFRAVFAVVLF